MRGIQPSAARGQRGASAVEFAIVLPVIALMLFGIIDFGVVLNNQNTVRAAAREGARLGAVAQFTGGAGCTIVGTVSSTETRGLMCLIKERNHPIGEAARVRVIVPSPYRAGEPLVVCVQTKMSSLTGFTSPFFESKTVTAKTTMRVERTSSGDFASGQETAPPGGSWTWCT
ncbi:MAG TPA: TadE family protein [Actinomycetota bacterium]|nr:TadE family protein [Actinomycetota bacterium]